MVGSVLIINRFYSSVVKSNGVAVSFKSFINKKNHVGNASHFRKIFKTNLDVSKHYDPCLEYNMDRVFIIKITMVLHLHFRILYVLTVLKMLKKRKRLCIGTLPNIRTCLPELFRPMRTFLPELFRQIRTYLPELYRQLRNYLSELHQ